MNEWTVTEYFNQAAYDMFYHNIPEVLREETWKEDSEKYKTVIRFKKENDKYIVEDFFEGEWLNIDIYFIPKNHISAITNQWTNPDNLPAYQLPNNQCYYIHKAIIEAEKKALLKPKSNKGSYGSTGYDLFSLRLSNELKTKMAKTGISYAKFINEAIAEKLTRDFGSDI